VIKNLTYLVIIVALVACKPENRKDCFKSNGSITTTTRELGAFDELILNDYIDYEIIPSAQYRIEITAGKNLLSNITSSVAKNSLTIENNNRCNFVRGYKHHPSVKIFMPKVKVVRHDGTGNTYISSDFKQDTIVITGGNSGDVYLSGSYKYVRTSSHGNTNIHFDGFTDELTVYMKGTNYLYAESAFISNNINVTTISIGDVYVKTQASTNLVVNMERDGNVYYKGNPIVILDKSVGNQKGKLIKND